MLFDPFKTYKAGMITANLIAAQAALEKARFDAGQLSDYNSAHPLYASISDALDAVNEARSQGDDVWELARP